MKDVLGCIREFFGAVTDVLIVAAIGLWLAIGMDPALASALS